MNVLVTGTNGYIGKSLYYGLKNYNITGINRNICDLTDFDQVSDFFKNKHFNVVIHCAASGGSRLKKDNNDIFKNNVKMFENLLLKKDHYQKFIHFGSGAQYDYPLTPYGLSKKTIADLIDIQPIFYNIIIWGLFNKNELNTRFIKSNIIKCMNDEHMIIHKDKYMDFFHMDDLIDIVNWYINANNDPASRNKTFECVYKEVYKLTHIAEMIALILGKTAKMKLVEEGLDKPYTGKNREFTVDSNFEDRLKETINQML